MPMFLMKQSHLWTVNKLIFNPKCTNYQLNTNMEEYGDLGTSVSKNTCSCHGWFHISPPQSLRGLKSMFNLTTGLAAVHI